MSKQFACTFFAVLLAVVAVSSVFTQNSDDDVWDGTVRDRTELCSSLAQYSPSGAIYCQQFEICCKSNFDPNNGDKCQVIESRCDDVGNTGVGVCKLSNCTELITTTTTTTTPSPQLDSINSSVPAFCFTSLLAAIISIILC